MRSVRVELNRKGVIELLQSDDVAKDLTERAERIAAAAGQPGDFAVTPTRNRDRAVVFVTTATHAAREAEAETRALTRAVDAGR